MSDHEQHEKRTPQKTRGRRVVFPLPSDFARVAPNKTRTQLRDHYLVSDYVLRKWIISSGVEPLAASRRTLNCGTKGELGIFKSLNLVVYSDDLEEDHGFNPGIGWWYPRRDDSVN